MSEHLTVLITATSGEEARHIADDLLERKLATCITLLRIQTMAMWGCAPEEGAEILMVVRTRVDRFQALDANIKARHSNSVSPHAGTPIILGSRDYLKWIDHDVNG